MKIVHISQLNRINIYRDKWLVVVNKTGSRRVMISGGRLIYTISGKLIYDSTTPKKFVDGDLFELQANNILVIRLIDNSLSYTDMEVK